MKQRSFDVAIVGAGLAGLQLARLLARNGCSVLLADARRNVTDCIRTTGIFVRKTFEDYPSLDPFLGPAIRAIGVHSPAGRSIALQSGRDEFRVGHMKPLYEAFLAQAIAAGATWSPATIYAGLHEESERTRVIFRDGASITTRFVVGADGARSRVARDLALDLNSRWIAGVENIRATQHPDAARFDVWIDPRLAPGYLAWIIDDGEEMHVGVGGDRRRFDPRSALSAFEARLRSEGRLDDNPALEQRGGLIPVNGVLRRIASRRGLLVGDAAGAVSPLTAGGLDACMRLSEHAASVLIEAQQNRAAMERYQGAPYRARFASRIAMRHAFDLATRSGAAVGLGFAMASSAPVRALVQHVFFARGSFPDATDTATPERRPVRRL